MARDAHLSKPVSLHRNILGTAKGTRLIRVDAVLATEDSANASLQLVAENLSDEGRSERCRLYLVVPAASLDIPQERLAIAHRIRCWVEDNAGKWIPRLGHDSSRSTVAHKRSAPDLFLSLGRIVERPLPQVTVLFRPYAEDPRQERCIVAPSNSGAKALRPVPPIVQPQK